MSEFIKKLGPLGNLQFDKLYLGQLFSHFSDAIVQFTLIAILLDKLPSAGKAIAITFFVFLVPQFLLSPFTGAFCDKVSRKLILSLSSLYRMLILVLSICYFYFVSDINVFVIYFIAFALGCGSAFFYPAKMSILPNIVDSSQLKFANALNSSIGVLAILFGAFVTDYIVKQTNTIFALGVIATCYLLSSIICATLTLKNKQILAEKTQ